MQHLFNLTFEKLVSDLPAPEAQTKTWKEPSEFTRVAEHFAGIKKAAPRVKAIRELVVA